MKIFTEQLYNGSWVCTDENYCGAEDSTNCEGRGKTELEALDNYVGEFESFYKVK